MKTNNSKLAKILKLAILFSLILSPKQILGDMGNSDIQAICRITLKDGKTIEGVILVGKGGYQRYLDTNGFYIIVDNPPHGKLKKAILFNLQFEGILPFKGKRFQGGSTSTNPTLAKNPQVYYINDITAKTHYIHETKVEEILQKEKKPLILKRKISHNLVYELLDHIPVYTRLPDVIHLESGFQQKEKIKPILVPMIQVEKFVLLRNPPQKWLDDIAEKTRTWVKKYGTCDDCVLMVEWYHELIKKPAADREYYEKTFKKWVY
jgi:hypothetical protein